MEQQLNQIPESITSQPSTTNNTINEQPPTLIAPIIPARAPDNDPIETHTIDNFSQYTLKTQPNHETSREFVHEVSTPRECRPMAECSIASSLDNLSPNHRRMRVPTFAGALSPMMQHQSTPQTRVTSNPQRSLNSHQQSFAHANRYRKDPASSRSTKRVVFNGTFPIDEPMSSRFDDGYAQDGSDSDYEEDIYREDDGEEHPDYEEDAPNDYRNGGAYAPHHCEDGLFDVGSRSTNQNRDQIRAEFETSANKFDQLIAQRRRDVFLHSVSDRDSSNRIGKHNI